MNLFYIAMAVWLSMILSGCATPVVTSITPISFYEKPVENKTPPYMIVDGVPYFLPKSVINVDITWNKDQYNWTVTVASVIQPDEKSKYLLKRISNAWFDDDITFAVDQNGLLQTMNISTADKTVSSITDLATAVGNIFAFGAGLMPMGPVAMMKGKAEEPPFKDILCSFHGEYDPFKPIEKTIPTLTSPVFQLYEKPVQKWEQVSATFDIKIEPLGDLPLTAIPDQNEIEKIRKMVPSADESEYEEMRKVAKDSSQAIHGIVVRTPVPCKISITKHEHVITYTDKKDLDRSETHTCTLMLPDVRRDYILPMNRRYLVTDQTKIALKDGMIQSIQQVRPSMVAGVVGIPKTILCALVPIPLQIRNTQSQSLQAIDTSIKTKADIKLQSQ
ncbi:MAG: hypothetical protein WBV23_04250 [Desulfobaccales bacterium]